MPEGFTESDLGKCEHAIGIPGTDWEVGLARPRNGKGYRLLFDFFGYQGRPILEKLGGEKASKFVQLYGIVKTELAAKKLGHATSRQTLKNGSVNVLISGGRF